MPRPNVFTVAQDKALLASLAALTAQKLLVLIAFLLIYRSSDRAAIVTRITS